MDTLRELVDSVEVDAEGWDYENNTALHLATRAGHVAAVQMLLKAGADPGAETRDQELPLHIALEGYASLPLVQALLAGGADPNGSKYAMPQPLHLAIGLTAHSPDVALSIVKALLEAGANPNLPVKNGDTPMHMAVRARQPALVRLLAAAGADLRRVNKERKRPMQLAENAHPTIAALVAAGDRDWALVPRPCPGLEGALGPVWRAAPRELPQLVARLTVDALERVRTALRALHLHSPVPPSMVMPVLARAFDY